MGTKNFDNALDLITFSRTSGGTALRRVGYGSELVTNGTFDTDVSGWTAANASLSIVGGRLRVTNTGAVSGYASFDMSGLVSLGEVFSYGIDGFAGTSNAGFRLGRSPNASDYSSSFNSQVGDSGQFVIATNTNLFFTVRVQTSGIGDYAEFDNISVKEVIFDRATDPLVLFTHPAEIPRIEYDAAGAVKGLLIEEARTNLLTYSQDFTDGSWAKTRSSVTLDATGPDGASNSATTFSDNSSGGTGPVSLARNVTVATSTVYTASVFAKADQLSKLRFNITNFTTPANGGTDFDLSSGAITLNNPNLDSENIEDCGNGWYRCSVTFTTDAADTTGSITFYPALADGGLSVPRDGTSSILVYGAQLEAGSFPTSYIPTNSGSTVTRAADVASIPVSAFGYNQKAGSVVVEFEVAQSNNIDGIVTLGGETWQGSNSNKVLSAAGTVRHLRVFDPSGVEILAIDAGTTPVGQTVKQAFTVKPRNYSAIIDGGSVVEDASTVAVPLFTLLGLRHSKATIKSIQYYPRRLSNAQLQELTT